MSIKLSVLMSVYNEARFLDQAINSVLSQIFSDFEFIIVDDASTDSSLEIISIWAKRDSRIRIIRNSQNIGLTNSLNKAIQEAKGEYIARIDADDISFPERFVKQVKFLNENSGYGLVGSWAEIIDDKNNMLRTMKYPTESKSLKKVLIKYNPFFHSSIMIRKKVFADIGFYHEEYKFAQDYELYFRVSKKYEVTNLPLILISYRETVDSITNNKNRKQIGFVIKAKLKALREGQYPKWCYIYLLRSYLAWLTPVWLKREVKRLFYF